MNGLIKQLFTPNCPVAQLAERKIKDLRRSCWTGFESKELCKNVVLIFTKWINVIAVCIYRYVITMGLCSKYDMDGHYSDSRRESLQILLNMT